MHWREIDGQIRGTGHERGICSRRTGHTETETEIKTETETEKEMETETEPAAEAQTQTQAQTDESRGAFVPGVLEAGGACVALSASAMPARAGRTKGMSDVIRDVMRRQVARRQCIGLRADV